MTPRTLRDWEKSGIGFPRNENGTYSGPAIVSWLVSRKSGEDGDELDPQKERARRDKEMADKLALENAERRGELVVLSEVVEHFGGHIDRCCSRLEQIPDALGQFCDPRVASVIVPECRRLIHQARSELAADMAASGTAAVREVDASADGNGEPVGGPEPQAVKRKQRRARPVAN